MEAMGWGCVVSCPSHPESTAYTLYYRPKGKGYQEAVSVLWCCVAEHGLRGHIVELVVRHDKM